MLGRRAAVHALRHVAGPAQGGGLLDGPGGRRAAARVHPERRGGPAGLAGRPGRPGAAELPARRPGARRVRGRAAGHRPGRPGAARVGRAQDGVAGRRARRRPGAAAGPAAGRGQALAPLVRCYAPGRVFSSAAERCVATVRPYAIVAAVPVQADPAFTVGAVRQATRRRAAEIVGWSAARGDLRAPGEPAADPGGGVHRAGREAARTTVRCRPAGSGCCTSAGTRWPARSGTTRNSLTRPAAGQRAWVRSRPRSSPAWRAALPRRSAATA